MQGPCREGAAVNCAGAGGVAGAGTDGEFCACGGGGFGGARGQGAAAAKHH